jgi:MATE family multidrug resistance protein
MPERPATPSTGPHAASTPRLRPPAQTLGEHIRRTVALAPPVMLARLGLVVMITVDTAMVGRVGGGELAAYAISMAPQIIMVTIGAGLLTGTVVLTAQADGAGEALRSGIILRFALLIATIMGLCFAAILALGDGLLLALGQSAGLSASGGRVLEMWALGMPGLTLFMAASFFLEGLSRPRAGMIVMLGANLLNFVLNWLLIYGHAGLPEMGAAGAALATSITRWAMFVAIALYIWFGIDHARYGMREGTGGDWRTAKRLMALGAPFGLGIGIETTAFATIATFAGWLGDLPLAAYHMAINFNALIYMLALGLSTATAVRVGNAIGRGDATGMRRAGWVGTGLVLVPMSAAALLVAVLPETVVGFYTTDPAVIPFALAALAIIPAVCISDGVQAVLMGAVRGAADIWVPNAIYAFSFWVLGVPLAWWWGVHHQGGAPALLWTASFGLTLSAILFAWRFHVLSRRHIARA